MPKRFRAAYVELTSVCSRHCSFCPGTRRPPGFMEPSRFAALAPDLADLVRIAYLHVMGEAMLHPEFPEIVRCAERCGLPLGMTTNGSLFGSPHAEFLLKPPFRQLNISLHAEGAKNDLDQILDFADRASRSDSGLCVNLRLWDVGADNEFFLRNIGNRWKVSIERRSGHCAVRLAERLSLHFDEAFEWPVPAETGEKEVHGFCRGGIDQFAVLYDGRVTACCLDAEGVLSFGRSPEIPLKKVLSCRAFEQMRNGFFRGLVLMPLCKNCTYRKRFELK